MQKKLTREQEMSYDLSERTVINELLLAHSYCDEDEVPFKDSLVAVLEYYINHDHLTEVMIND